jgi:uncharacterized membrane protein
MSTLTPSSDVVSQAGRAAHQLGLAALLGGNLFGRLALHPSVTRISDPGERGAVVNAAWRRYGTINTIGLVAMAGGWAGARAEEARGAAKLTPTERVLARVKDGLVATVVATGVLTAIEGIRFSRTAPGGAVPMVDGSTAGPGAPAGAARMKRTLNVLGATAIGAEAALVAVDAALAQEDFRRAPLRRRLRRWGSRGPLG